MPFSDLISSNMWNYLFGLFKPTQLSVLSCPVKMTCLFHLCSPSHLTLMQHICNVAGLGQGHTLVCFMKARCVTQLCTIPTSRPYLSPWDIKGTHYLLQWHWTSALNIFLRCKIWMFFLWLVGWFRISWHFEYNFDKVDEASERAAH